MLLVSNLTLRPGQPEQALLRLAARECGQPVRDLVLTRQSIDARKKSDVRVVCSVRCTCEDETRALAHSPRVTRWERPGWRFPEGPAAFAQPPVVVGMGPAGLFCALLLARAGARPLVVERGRPVEQRTGDVAAFWRGGQLLSHSNVQFGEGGAGTFSDGKLNTGTHDPRQQAILETFARFGAPEEILYQAAPHVGTDRLRTVVAHLRQELLSLGAEIRFETQLVGLEHSGGQLNAVRLRDAHGETRVPTSHVCLAIGHSARDTFAMLQQCGIPLQQKAFAMGVRIEHRQADISRAQYGAFASQLPPASYKLACHLPDGRGVFSFCVCPGGTVVASASEPGHLVTNGMSEFARDQENINGALLVSVTPADFGSADPLAGVALQRQLERAAFLSGGGDYCAPCQRVEDFLLGRASTGCGTVRPSYRPGVRYTDLHQCLPGWLSRPLEAALPLLGRRLSGYDAPDALLTAAETRSSSPVRILRDAGYQSSLRGLYPCGEGAGYAGGILSAAADGLRVGEAMLRG